MTEIAMNTMGVTPFVGVWIEIKNAAERTKPRWSLPLWECGLKFEESFKETGKYRHSLCGSVD